MNLFIVVAFQYCLSYVLNFKDQRLYFGNKLFYDTDQCITATARE